MGERVALVIALLFAVGVVGAGFWYLTVREAPDLQAEAEAAVDLYLQQWEAGDWEALAGMVREPSPEVAALHEDLWSALEVTATAIEHGPVTLDRAQADTELTVRLTLAGLGEWEYASALRLLRADREWRVVWSPAVVHPDLRDGDRLRRDVTAPTRESILAHDGTPLTVPGEIHVVGIHPERMTDPDEVVAALVEHTRLTEAQARRTVDRDDLRPDWFYPMVELRPQEFDRIWPQLRPVPGVVFRTQVARLTPAEGFAQHVLGRTGEITAELLEELGDPYQPGDTVGRSGLERAFERQLAGSASAEIVVVRADGQVRGRAHTFEGDVPEPVRTTLDEIVQEAAEEALAGVEGRVGLVALDVPSGAIRAVVSRPLDEFNRALAGRYPPGSAFKVVTAAALLADGTGVDDPVDCPAEAVVGGLRVANAGGLDLGETTLRAAFARSCNTTFARLGAGLDPGDLAAAAARFGFGTRYGLPLDSAGGSFPDPGDTAERAAAAFGQARVQASPLHLASVAAAAASGTWHAPYLLADEPSSESRDLGQAVAAALRELLREVVVAGTGTAADVPGSPVHGKTGSAEVERGGPTHAWFVGFRDDLAFAVVVEEGGAGGEVAAPLAADFLRALDERRHAEG